jgi:hypothetical protein
VPQPATSTALPLWRGVSLYVPPELTAPPDDEEDELLELDELELEEDELLELDELELEEEPPTCVKLKCWFWLPLIQFHNIAFAPSAVEMPSMSRHKFVLLRGLIW